MATDDDGDADDDGDSDVDDDADDDFIPAPALGFKLRQGSIEWWILKVVLDMSQPALVRLANHRISLVSLHTIVGHIQVVVAHSLVSSYTKHEITGWWAQLKDAVKASFTNSNVTLWFIDAMSPLAQSHLMQ